MFAIIIFLCDDFVVLHHAATPEIKRFFNIAQRLPMELQMLLSNRIFISPKEVVLKTHSEPAFKQLAHSLLMQ